MRHPLPMLAAAVAGAILASGCAPKDRADPVPSVTALEADPILLSRVLGRCNAHPETARNPECVNARAAADRQAAAGQADRARRAESSFEKARDARRLADEAAASHREAQQKPPSPYELPVEGEEKPAPSSP